MASFKSTSAIALFLLVRILFFTFSSACGGGCPTPKPKPKPKPTPSPKREKCPIDALKLEVCANVLQGFLNITIGKPPVTPCCSLIQGLADVEATVCLCTAIKASILGINLNIPLCLSLLLNVCNKNVPKGFQCP